LHNNKWEAER